MNKYAVQFAFAMLQQKPEDDLRHIEQWKWDCQAIANVFVENDRVFEPGFDRDVFLAACGFTSEDF